MEDFLGTLAERLSQKRVDPLLVRDNTAIAYIQARGALRDLGRLMRVKGLLSKRCTPERITLPRAAKIMYERYQSLPIPTYSLDQCVADLDNWVVAGCIFREAVRALRSYALTGGYDPHRFLEAVRQGGRRFLKGNVVGAVTDPARFTAGHVNLALIGFLAFLVREEGCESHVTLQERWDKANGGVRDYLSDRLDLSENLSEDVNELSSALDGIHSQSPQTVSMEVIRELERDSRKLLDRLAPQLAGNEEENQRYQHMMQSIAELEDLPRAIATLGVVIQGSNTVVKVPWTGDEVEKLLITLFFGAVHGKIARFGLDL